MPPKESPPQRRLGRNAQKAEDEARAKREAEEAVEAEYKRNGPAIDPELDWSDDEKGEKDWHVISPVKENAVPREQREDEEDAIPDHLVIVQPKVVVKENTEDYIRSKIKLQGDVADKARHGVRGILPHEARIPQYSSYRLPIPVLPAHVRHSLGLDVLEHLWHEFLEVSVCVV